MEKIKQKESILAIVTGLVIIGWFIDKQILYPIAGGIGLICLLSEFITAKIHWLWMKIAHIMGSIMSKILLGIIFYLILFPLSVFARMSNKNMLQLKKSPGSYYQERNHLYKKEDLENIW